ncbi:NADP-dependent oxidoreductase [Marinibacterium profundimaris]|uniref:NADP-dependent oxidoreductase n=1 Tax=Marinibacterium profundimaris TaxID=1679460 RepID=A0A225NCG2_9RHOB|nr:NADP-dependent oxidoreductase [Marinibacterium profundimaris]OWU69002.1 NADP-dependent oxidoreductase [Marinibacterium profundimaris]
MPDTMRRIVLASRPDAAPVPDNFRLEETAMPTPGEGEVLVKVEYMSLDPYMRGRMSAAKSYSAPVEIGETMTAGAVGEVIASNSADFAPGDKVLGMFGWADHGCLPASQLRKLDPSHGPITTALGILGMPGITAWHGLNKIGQPKAGETLVVAAATGPVGSLVGQLAKAKGLRVVGIAGGPEKCKLATETFGFDACLDHRAYEDAKALSAALQDACPDGIDIYYENVGGKVLAAVLENMNAFGRIPVCGMIAWYNGAGADDMPLAAAWRSILTKFLTVQGFIIFNHYDTFPQFIEEVGPKVGAGELRYLEDVAEGLENAPETFISMLKGGNTGKQIVKIA